MKTTGFSVRPSRLIVLLSLLAASAGLAQDSTNLSFAIRFWYPTNGQIFNAPANIGLRIGVADSNVVQTVQFFSGTNSLKTVTNTQNVLLTNWSTVSPFYLMWSNVPTGSYTLSAVATDSAGITTATAPVNISVQTPPPPPPVRPSVYIYSPTNGSMFLAPANLTLYARAAETTGTVQTVEFFAGATSLGVVSNNMQAVFTNICKEPLFPLSWPNVQAAGYSLRAVATDARGLSSTSAVVNIYVVTNLPPPPVVRPSIYFRYPTNGAKFLAPTNLTLYARAAENTGIVQSVEFFAGNTSLGVVPNSSQVVVSNLSSEPLFPLVWPNVPVGCYALKAVATDAHSITATSAVVNICVVTNTPPPPPTNRPPEVRITSPANTAIFRAPVNIPIYAYARDPDGYVTTVEFLAGTNSLGFGSPVPHGTNQPPASYYTNLFFLVWSNAPLGPWALTARATDNSNAVAVSLPVNITVLPPSPPPTNRSPVVLVSATDPIAIEGTNCWVWSNLSNAVPAWTNWPAGVKVPYTNCGPKNAIFSIYRSGDTNNPLTVTYALGGTGTNGMDYVALPGVVTIPAGQRRVMVTVVPIDDGPPDLNSTVILHLTPSTNSPPDYAIGSPGSAEALILDSPSPTPATAALPDKTFHVNASGPNGAWFHIEYTTDLVHWTSICTNQVINGSIDFIDPDAPNAPTRFYRAVPEANPPQ